MAVAPGPDRGSRHVGRPRGRAGRGLCDEGLPAFLGLVAAQAVAVILLLAYLRPDDSRQRDRTGAGLALGGVAFLILGFLWAFAFTYAYTLEIFRGVGLPVFLAAGLLAGLPGLRPARKSDRSPLRRAGAG